MGYNVPYYPGIPISNRPGGWGTDASSSAVSDGTNTYGTYMQKHTIPSSVGEVDGLYITYGNENGETLGLNPITVECLLRVASTTDLYPARVNGSPTATTATIRPGERVTFYVPFRGRGGDTFHIFTGVSVASVGQKWPLGCPAITNFTDKYLLNTSGTTLGNANPETGLSNSDVYGYGPMVVSARAVSASHAVVAIAGDSIPSGQVDAGTNYSHEGGFFQRACDTAGVPNIKLCLPGMQGATWTATAAPRKRMKLAGVSVLVWQFGINDCANNVSLATLKANLIAALTDAKRRGVQKCIVTTITPHDNTLTGPQEVVRAAYNTWLRDGTAVAENPTLIDYVADVAATVESASNGGAVSLGGVYWATVSGNATKYNSLHPNQYGHAAMAGALTSAMLTSASVTQEVAGTMDNAAAVTLDSTISNPGYIRVGVGGALKVLPAGASDDEANAVSFALQDGESTAPLRVKKVYQDGTTAQRLLVIAP